MNRKTVLVAGALIVAVGLFMDFSAIAQMLATPHFTSTSRVVLHSPDPAALRGEAERLSSDQLLLEVVTNLNLTKVWSPRYSKLDEMKPTNVVLLLRRHVDVLGLPGTSALEIKVWSEEKSESMAIANELAKRYLASTLAPVDGGQMVAAPIQVDSIQPAEMPQESSRPNRTLCIILVILGSLLTPIGLTLMINAARRPRRRHTLEPTT